MPKDIEINEGGPLMDPTGEAFQKMLASAQAGAVEALAKAPDTSMVEDEKDVKPVDKLKPASSAASTEEEEAEEKVEKVEEIPGDDIGNLKNKVSGLQAELARVRKQKTGSADEAQGLKERIADMEGQLKVLREGKTADTIEAKLAKLTDDQVEEYKISWEDELADARVIARLAEKDNDTEAVKVANKRITDARSMLKLYGTEERRRVTEQANAKSTEKEDREGIATEVETLFTDLYTAAPDLQDKKSDIWKAGQAEFTKLPRLMKALGPLGELIAAASAIAKNPQLIGKKVISAETGKVIDTIESLADKVFQKGGSAPSKGTVTPIINIKSREDHASFEEMVRKVKSG